jgi:hypothetical protein
MRGDRAWDEEADEHEALWEALMERVCPVPNAREGRASPHRAFHQDLPLLGELDLALDRQRALLRACMEKNMPNRFWLEERMRRIDEELVARGITAQPTQPAAPTRSAAARAARQIPPASRSSVRPVHVAEAAEALDQEIDWQQHQAWLRHQAAQATGDPAAPSASRPSLREQARAVPKPTVTPIARPASTEADPWAGAGERGWQVLPGRENGRDGGDGAADSTKEA